MAFDWSLVIGGVIGGVTGQWLGYVTARRHAQAERATRLADERAKIIRDREYEALDLIIENLPLLFGGPFKGTEQAVEEEGYELVRRYIGILYREQIKVTDERLRARLALTSIALESFVDHVTFPGHAAALNVQMFDVLYVLRTQLPVSIGAYVRGEPLPSLPATWIYLTDTARQACAGFISAMHDRGLEAEANPAWMLDPN